MESPLAKVHRSTPKLGTQEEKEAAVSYEALTSFEKSYVFRYIERLLVEVAIENRTSCLRFEVIPEHIPVKEDVGRLKAELIAWLVDPNREPYVHAGVRQG